MIVVSKCLIGYNCKYNGQNNYNPSVVEYLKDKQYIAVCAEELGGLSTPRIPSEIRGEMVFNAIGEDVTKQFEKGAKKAYEIVKKQNIEYAILKAKSPSCGSGKIYDGTFSATLIKGSGKFAKLLEDDNIPIFNEKNFKQ